MPAKAFKSVRPFICEPIAGPPAATFDAGWSSPVARQAHNLKVTGSNPVPAPKQRDGPRENRGGRSTFWRARIQRLTAPDPLPVVAQVALGGLQLAGGHLAAALIALD